MPRIDPAQLLKTLSVLLGPHGGIKSLDEVTRLVQLMEKFSKKLVSKVVYIKILMATKPEILDKFLGENGWDLLNFWFAEGIRAMNWSLCSELMQLFLLCPMTPERLRENSEKNTAPKLVRQLTFDTRVENEVRDLANQVLKKWMTVIQVPAQNQGIVSAPLRTRARGQRGQSAPPPGKKNNSAKLAVTVFTTEVEDIASLVGMSCRVCPQAETEYWMGRMGKTLKIQARKAKAAAKPKVPKPVKVADPLDLAGPQDDPNWKAPGEEDEDDDEDEDEDDEFADIMRRANNALNRRYGKIEKPVKQMANKTTKVSTIKDYKTQPSSPLKNEVSEMSTGGMNGVVKDEVMDVEDLLKDDDDDDEMKLKNSSKEVKDDAKADEKGEKTDQKVKEKEKDHKKERNRDKDKEKRKDTEKDKERDREKDKDKDKHRHSSKDDDRRRKEKEERRRKEKERERERHKEKDRSEKKRESKPFKETEMRNGLDSKEKEKIRMVAQMLKDESKKNSELKSSSVSGLSKIPKIPKKEEDKKDDKTKKQGLSFEALMGAMDKTTKTIKAPPIKNKNKDLLASFSTPSSSKPKPEAKPVVKEGARDFLRPIITEDKTSKIVPAADLLADDKKAEKRPAETDVPKIKVKSPSELSFGDFLSTIMKDDQPKKKKIKIAELKAKTLQEEEKEKEKREKELAEAKEKEEKTEAPALSFYRDTLLEENNEATPAESSPALTADMETAASPDNSLSPKPDTDTQEQMEVGPRDVRGILVYAKGAVRQSRRITWKAESDLVQVEYFELDETERVNVNKLKFEEMRKKEFELEKSALQRHQVAAEETRPWSTLKTCDFNPPDVTYGSQSVEKVTQEQRENSVLQALYFNNRLPNDPSEPENLSNVRFETKVIPLEDVSEEETFYDYSATLWPQPLPDNIPRKPVSNSPQTEAIFANIQQNLHSMMGGGNFGNGNAIENAMLAAQKAAEEELRKQGLLPPTNDFPAFHGSDHPYDGNEAGEHLDQPYEPGDEPYEPMDTDYDFPPGPGTGLLGPKPPQYQQFTPTWNQGPRMNFRGGKRGFDSRGRGFHRGNRGRGNFNDRSNKDGIRDDRKKDYQGRPPCKFWTERGFCREGTRCRFPHPRR